MTALSVGLLGPFEVRRDGQPVPHFPYAKVQALLAYLALESHHPQPRASLAALLWPDQPDRAARASLSQALSTLRGLLGDKNSPRPVLLADTDTVQFDPQRSPTVDVAQFLAWLRAAEAHAHRSWRTCTPCAGRLRQAVALYRGDFLAGLSLPDSAPFEEWAALQREHLRQRALSAFGRLADWAEWRGQYTEAIEAVRHQVALEPLLETNHRHLLRLLALNGETAAALAHARGLEILLAHELAAKPEAATLALTNQISQGDLTGLRRDPPFAVPNPPTGLVGRGPDLEALCSLLQAGTRALTVTGTAGVGKTRLALEAAHRLRYEFEAGVYFVELAPLTDARLVPEAVARTLGIPERPGRSSVEALRAHLRAQHLLLILDNFEHVLPAAPLLAELLSACPALQVLATSRERLNLRVEQQLPLAPLDAREAVRLFRQRLQAAGAGPADDVDWSAYREICARLDGLPLAIELFAARSRRLSPSEMLRQLNRPLQALVRGPRDAPERHQALRSAIQWSYDLLASVEQSTFEHAGVFAGGCTAEAAQAVAGASPDVGLSLEALCEANLLQRQATADEQRSSMLATLRDFALERLAARGETAAARQRHAEHFLALAERAEPELIGSDQKTWFDRLGREHANLRAALAWAQAARPELSLRLATALGQYWEVRGNLGEGRDWIETGLRRAPQAPLDVRARALLAAGRIAYSQRELKASQPLLAESRQLFLRLEDPSGLARVLYRLGIATALLGDFEAGRGHLQAGLAAARSAGDLYAEAGALLGLGVVAERQGDPALGLRYAEQALALHQARGDPRNTAGVLLNTGVALFSLGDFGAARQRMEASLAVAHQLADYQLTTVGLVNLGNVLIALDDPAAAQARLEEAIAIHHAHLDDPGAASALGALGRALEKLGDLDAARNRQAEALRLRVEGGDRRGIAVSLTSLARLDQREGQPARAATLLGAADAIRQAMGAVLSPSSRAENETLVASVRAALSDAAFERAWAEGHALSQEEAVALALHG